MKKLFALMLLIVFSLPLLAEEWKNAPVTDAQCAARTKADPDSHTKQCAMKCSKAGFGIVTQDGKFLKFDDKGNKEMMDALDKTDKNDHIRVDVKGEQAGDVIKVESLKLS